MIDITTIQTFRVPPSIKVLQEANEALKLANDTLLEKNDTLQKLIIVSFIGLGLVLFVKILKNKKTKKSNEKNRNNNLR
jgi:hypothetical protein